MDKLSASQSVAPQLTAEAVQQLLHQAMPVAEHVSVELIEQGRARIRLNYGDWMLRPGNTLSGPSIMTAADTAMYVLILSHYGPALLAVTSTMNINFLNKPAKGDLIAEAQFKKTGRKLVFCDVDVYSSAADECVAHVTGSYSLPSPKR